MSTQNTTAVVLDDTRELLLQEHTDTVVDETVAALIREAQRTIETLGQPKHDHRQPKPTYPSWPTSKPGPRATSSLPGMKPVSTRTDQMVYECYDQERGKPCADVPARRSIRSHPMADPRELYHMSRSSGATVFPDISGASLLGKFPPTPAETGHYHYGPLGPGINTDASGSYAPHEIDPYGRHMDRPVKLYITGKRVRSRAFDK